VYSEAQMKIIILLALFPLMWAVAQQLVKYENVQQ
jgi:hypothetical protein